MKPDAIGRVTAMPSPAPLSTPVLLGLTAVTGIVDAVCFLALGQVFTANMTGNVVLLGFAMAGVESLSALRSATAISAFVAGAVIGVRLSRSMPTRSMARGPAAAFAVEAALLLLSAIVVARGGGAAAGSIAVSSVIVTTGLAMGLRSATIRQLGERDINTTVLTMTLTGIAIDSVLAGGNNREFSKRLGSVGSMVVGATVGAWLVTRSAAMALLFAAAASTTCAVAAYLTMRTSTLTEASTSSGKRQRAPALVGVLHADRSRS